MKKTDRKKPAPVIYNLDSESTRAAIHGESGLATGLRLSLQNRYIQLVLLFTVCGFILRFYNITYNSIWLDEAATLNFSRNSLIEIWNITASGEFNPPLFHWIEHFMLTFGSSELVLRFVPALLGACTVPLFYWVGKESIDSNVGVIATALLAFSPFHIFYSQDARAYTTLLFFFTLALFFYFKALHQKKRSNWVLFGLFSALAFWTHFYVFIPILGMYCYAVALPALSGKKIQLPQFKDIALSLVVFILITLPLVVVTIRLFLVRTGTPPTYGIQGTGIITETINQISGVQPLIAALLFILFLIGMVEIWMYRKKCCVFVLWILLLTFLASYLLSYSMPMIPRYLIFLLPLYFIGIAASYRFFFRLIPTPKVVYVLICIFVVLSLPTLSAYYTTYSKENWRELGGALPGITHEGDAIVLLPSYMRMPFEYYYSNESDQTQVYGASNVDELQRVLGGIPAANRVFYIMTADITATDPSGKTIQWLEVNTQHIGSSTGIYLFTTPKAG